MQVDTFKAIAGVPWMIKPLYGFVTDTFPILGRRRRPYLILCGLSGVPHGIILFATAIPRLFM